MQIAITTATATLGSAVCTEFQQSPFLLILTVSDAGEVLTTVPLQIEQGHGAALATAQIILQHRCEAVLTGSLPEAAFDLLADAGITRYHAIGLMVEEAVHAMNNRQLDFIRSPEGAAGCSGHQHHS